MAIQIQDLSAGAYKPGDIVPSGKTTGNTGFLHADGSSQLVATYPHLHEAIGFTYGGSGANFNLPDLRGRSPVGPDDMGTAAGDAGRVGSNDAMGNASGADVHLHTASTGAGTLPEAAPGGVGAQRNQSGHTHAVTVNNQSTMQPYQVVTWLIKT